MTGYQENSGIYNLAIMASAGTGKTYNLAMRFIRILLTTEISPSSIAAITFSNKAAGEIFEKIITRLTELAMSPAELDQAITDGYLPENATQHDMIRLLRTILSSREKSGISTIDSFFLQIVQTFPLECGISGKVQLINQEDDRPRIKALLKALAGTDDAKRKQLIEYVKIASYGTEERSLVRTMQKFLNLFYPCYMDHPERAVWVQKQNPEQIRHLWAEYDHANILTEKTLDEYKEKILNLMQGKDKRLLKNIESLFNVAKTYEKVRDMKKLQGFLQRLIPDSETLYGNDCLRFTYYKDYVLPSFESGIFRKLALHFATIEFEYAIARTEAVYELMRSFDKTYAAGARYMGQLTYHDIPCMIRQGDPAYKMQLGERIDAKIDHYMLDEFQDTSTGQWQILEDLVNEAIMNDASGRFRSFFFVGDIKQSIYQWREGNYELFHMICSKYNFETEEEIEQKREKNPDYENSCRLQTLTRSFRSSVPVIQTVNQVFSTPHRDLDVMESARENLYYEQHESSSSAAKQPGCAMLMTLPEKDQELKERIVCRLVQNLNPFKRKKPLKVGILVRENKNAFSMAETFRKYAPELPVTIDGEIRLEDCMAFSVFRQMLRHAAHPADTMALHFLEMLPGGRNGLKEKLMSGRENDSLSSVIRDIIDADGYSGLLTRFLKIFPEMNRDDLERMRLLERFVIEADREKPENTDDFLQSLHFCKGTTSSIHNTVQIMTIHKSKGLDFDAVILPDNSGSRNIAEERNTSRLAVRKTNYNTETQWISFLPDKDFIHFYPEFEKYQQEADQAACYENYCKLYVALTRARNALYIITDPLPEKEEQQRFSNILEGTLHSHIDPAVSAFSDALSCGEEIKPVLRYVTGDPFWYQTEEYTEPAKEQSGATSALIRVVRDSVPVQQSVAPSRLAESEDRQIKPRFAAQSSAAADFGTLVHEALSDFTFCESPAQLEEFLQKYEVLRPFMKPQILHELKRPDYPCILRREQAFQVRLPDGKTVSGCFDRIVLKTGADGQIVSAEILDYKTDRCQDVQTLLNRHQGQLNLYRTALAILLGIPESAITCKVLALTHGLVLTIPLRNPDEVPE